MSGRRPVVQVDGVDYPLTISPQGEPHRMVAPEVTRFSRAVPIEVMCHCGACPDSPPLFGRGDDLAACRADLLAKFAAHAGIQWPMGATP